MTDDTGIGGPGERFPATRHSAVLAAQSPDLLERERGLAILVEAYWKPAYKYLRRRFGESNEDAKDLTQEFFARAIEKEFFDGYDPAKGSFRTYLRTCLDRFVANEKKAAGRQKRSPGTALLALDFADAESELTREAPSKDRPMEQYFHDEFVRSLLTLSIEKLREDCMLRGKDLPYLLFERYDVDRDPDEKLSYERLAEEFHIPVTQVTNFLAFARREFRRIVLEKLREITANDREFREEARSLLGVSPVKWLSDRTLAHLRRVAEMPDLAPTKYRLLEELGRGGMGTVYLAEDVMLERRVALKVVATGLSAPDAAERMLREARILAGLEHPGIVPVHDAGALPDGRVFYAMKRVDGKRLDSLAPTLALPERLRIFQRICETAAFAHARGVVHRDLKPENVMVGPFGEVLVLDWGVARILAEAAGATAARSSPARPGDTAEGTVVGTPGYMAPEQAEGAIDRTGPRADVFALGAILRFLLSHDAAAPKPLAAAAEKAMSRRPEDRYQTAEELSAEVTRYLEGSRVLAHSEGALERAGRLFARYRAPILLILAYLVVRSLLLVFRR